MENVIYKGVSYHVKKSSNGLVFASETLFDAITDSEGNFIDEEAEDIDELVAFFFEEDEFLSLDSEGLFDVFNKHS